MEKLKPIDGSCHCGNIRFVLRWPASDPVLPARRCGCTFCAKHHGRWTSHRSAELAVYAGVRESVFRYRFGTGTADFFGCSTCGVVPLAISTIDGSDYAVVNVNTFDDPSRLSFDESATDFDAEDTGSRLERRKRNWIPSVTIDQRNH